jgi:hypothetical protein
MQADLSVQSLGWLSQNDIMSLRFHPFLTSEREVGSVRYDTQYSDVYGVLYLVYPISIGDPVLRCVRYSVYPISIGDPSHVVQSSPS